MHRHAQAVALLVLALLVSSCSDSDTPLRQGLTQPTSLDASAISVSASSSSVIAQPVDHPLCPTVAPFNVVLTVIVRPTGTSTVFITGVNLVFTDLSGIRVPQVSLPMPQVTLPAPLPIIGSSQLTASNLNIPVSVGIGCASSQQGTLTVTVNTADNQGHRGSQSVSVAVR
jgi:hypothetical protein